jgi:16S rRNA G527 N7-methylase RsmG
VSTPPGPGAARERLLAAADAFGWPRAGVDALLAYVAAVWDENQRVNLTGASSLDVALDVLAIDALPIARAWDGSRGPPRAAIDLGTGNGLPGVAVALAWPACRTLLVERRAKKANAVARCLAAAGIENAEALACDGRELLRLRPDLRARVDLVTVRAVGDLAPTTKEAVPWLAPRGRIVHWKPSPVKEAERTEGDAAAKNAGLAVLGDVVFRVPGAAADRGLVIYER